MSWHYLVTNQLGAFGSNTTVGITQNQYDNAIEIKNQLTSAGWGLKAICALLGNIQYESYINPAQTQSGYPIGTTTGGYGLVQWTPARDYYNWASSQGVNITDGNAQVRAIDTDALSRYYSTQSYPISFADFKVDTEHTVEWLTKAFEYNYERGTWSNQRVTDAEYWYEYFNRTPQYRVTINDLYVFPTGFRVLGSTQITVDSGTYVNSANYAGTYNGYRFINGESALIVSDYTLTNNYLPTKSKNKFIYYLRNPNSYNRRY